MADDVAPSAPSADCGPRRSFEPEAGFHLCFPTIGVDTFPNWRTRPDLGDDQIPGGRDYTQHGTTPGFGPGMALLPYVVDWGDYLGAVTRRKLHPSILKAWPRPEDRLTALLNAPRYVQRLDTCQPPVTTTLILAQPFAGWRWDAVALRQWLDLVELDPGCQGITPAVSVDAAVATATAWLARAERLWNERTEETFPYTVRDVYDLWKPRDTPSGLP